MQQRKKKASCNDFSLVIGEITHVSYTRDKWRQNKTSHSSAKLVTMSLKTVDKLCDVTTTAEDLQSCNHTIEAFVRSGPC